jgi:hypothetical protein
VVNQDAVVVAMVGARSNSQQVDASAVLNEVCREGWELINGDFVFVMKGVSASGPLTLSSGGSGRRMDIAGARVVCSVPPRWHDQRADED